MFEVPQRVFKISFSVNSFSPINSFLMHFIQLYHFKLLEGDQNAIQCLIISSVATTTTTTTAQLSSVIKFLLYHF